jgi:hypothetical protein
LQCPFISKKIWFFFQYSKHPFSKISIESTVSKEQTNAYSTGIEYEAKEVIFDVCYWAFSYLTGGTNHQIQ